jgi:Tfp pilus assembly protein PilF
VTTSPFHRLKVIEEKTVPETPSPDAIRTAVEKIVSSPQLESSPSLCRFLRYVVAETLAGRGGMIKEYSLGAEVFSRGDDFDPRIDPIVRVQARNLRARMAKYYEGPGASEPVVIDLPKRTYVPVFTSRETALQEAPEAAPVEVVAEPAPEPAALVRSAAAVRAPKRNTARVAAAGIVVLLAGAALSFPMRPSKGKGHEPDAAAVDQYIRGRFLMDRHNEKALRESVAAFERAVEKDANFAAAWAGMADAYNLLAQYGYLAPPEAMEKARGFARKALSLDPHLPEAHVSLAAVIEAYDWDWAAAEREYKRAMQLNPASATANLWYGMFLRDQGRIDEALPLLRRAAQMTPVSEMVSANLAYALIQKGNHSAALEQAEIAAELNPRSVSTQLLLASVYRSLARRSDAEAALLRAEEVADDNAHGLSVLARIHARNGRNEKGALLMKRLEDLAAQRYVSPFDLATVSLVMGDEDRALALFQEAYRQRSSGMIFLNEKSFASVRQKEQFQQLIPKMHRAG